MILWAMAFLQKHKVPLFISLFVLFAFIYFYPAGLEPADGGLKHFQVLDFIKQNFQTLECYYPEKEIDPDLKFIPWRGTFFLHIIDNKCYYVFPFYLTFLLTPLHLIFGTVGEYLLPLFGFIWTVWLLWLWSDKLSLTKENRIYFLLYFGLGTGLLHYAFLLSETNVNSAMLNTAFYLTWRSIHEKSDRLFLASALLLGLAVYLRQESLIVGILLVGFCFLTRTKTFLQSLGFLSIYLFLIGLWAFVNGKIFGNPLGLRGVEQVTAAADPEFISKRIRMFYEFFLHGRDNVGLFLSSPLLVLIPFYIRKWKTLDRGFLPIFLTAVAFVLILPFAVVNYQGVGWGTRFALSMTPVLLLSVVLFHQSKDSFSIPKWARIVTIVWSILGVCFYLVVLGYAKEKFAKGGRFLKANASDTIVIVSEGFDSSTFAVHNEKKVFHATTYDSFSELSGLLKKKGITTNISLVYPSSYFFDEKTFFTENVLNQIQILDTKESKEIVIRNISLK